MKVGITVLRRHLSELLDRVAGGEEIRTGVRKLPSQKELRGSISVSGRPLSLEIANERTSNRN